MLFGYMNVLSNWSNKNLNIIVIISFLLLVFFPTSIYGPSLNVFILIINLFIISLLTYNLSYIKSNIVFIFIFLMFFSIKCIDFIYYENLRLSDYVRILFILSSLFIVASNNIGYKKNVNFLFLIFFLEMLILIIQFISPEITGFFYSQEKLGYRFKGYNQFRYVGSLHNPNLFGLFIIFIFSLFLNKDNRFMAFFLVLIFIFISGSRSSFMAIFIAYFFYELSIKFTWHKVFYFVLSTLISLSIVGYLLYIFADEFYYFSQISIVMLDIFSGNGLSSFEQVSSLTGRFDKWIEVYNAWIQGGVKIWLFGLPSTEEFRYLDNSYLYILTKYGIFGGGMLLFCIYSIVSNIYFKINSTENRRSFLLFIGSVLICSIFSDFLINYYFLGMLVSYVFLLNHERC